MKKIVRILFALLTIIRMDVSAAPLQRSVIPANPAWLLHLDCDALRQTYLGQYILYHLDKPEVYNNIVSFRNIFGFDLRTNLQGITFYACGPAAADCVIITYADFDSSRLITFCKSGEGAQIFTNNQHLIYSFIDKAQKNNPEGGRRFLAILKNCIIGGTNKRRLIDALGVIDGGLPNLAASKASPEFTAAGDGIFLEAATSNLNFLEAQPSVAFLKFAKWAKLEAREANDETKASLTINANDEDTAKRMSVASQGLVALLGLQKDVPEMAKLANSIIVKQSGATLSATLSVPSVDLITALKAYNAKNEKQKAAAK